jgi:hypothetical protein
MLHGGCKQAVKQNPAVMACMNDHQVPNTTLAGAVTHDNKEAPEHLRNCHAQQVTIPAKTLPHTPAAVRLTSSAAAATAARPCCCCCWCRLAAQQQHIVQLQLHKHCMLPHQAA